GAGGPGLAAAGRGRRVSRAGVDRRARARLPRPRPGARGLRAGLAASRTDRRRGVRGDLGAGGPAMTAPAVLTLGNASAAPIDQLPHHAVAGFSKLVARSHGRRISALFARPRGSSLEAIAVMAADGDGVLELAATEIGESFPSITPICPEVHLFEREIWEQWGAVPVGHPWRKPVRFQPPAIGPRGDVADGPDRRGDRPAIGIAEFYRVEGDEVHEVAVGPVHAGVIEPGHFRFQCHGEEVFHLEISLGYQHRGVERAL